MEKSSGAERRLCYPIKENDERDPTESAECAASVRDEKRGKWHVCAIIISLSLAADNDGVDRDDEQKKKRKIQSIYARGKGDGKERGRGLEEEKGRERKKREREDTLHDTTPTRLTARGPRRH